jgi:hypothetical protein
VPGSHGSGRRSEFLATTARAAACLYSVLLVGLGLRALGADTLGSSVQVIASLPWVMLEVALGLPAVVVRPLGAGVTAVLIGVNLSARR